MTGSRWAKQADAVVAGGGIRGVTITYYLAQAGIKVVLFERHELLHGASGANLRYVNVSREPGYHTQISLASQRLYRTLARLLGDEIDYQCRGSLNVAETEAQLRALTDFACKQSLVPGLQVGVLDTAQARDLEPALSPQMAGAPITGQAIAELMTTGTTSWSIAEYNPSRFARVRLMFPMAMSGRWLEEHR